MSNQWGAGFSRRHFRAVSAVSIILAALWMAPYSLAQEGGTPDLSYPEHGSPSDITPFIFSRDVMIHDVEMSPDGKHAAVIFPQGDNYQIEVISLEPDGDDEKHLLTNVSVSRFNSITWANNSRLLLHVGSWNRFNFYGFAITLGQPDILAVSHKGGTFESIWRSQAGSYWEMDNFRIVSMLPDEDDFILIQETPRDAEYPAVFKVDILTGLAEQIQAPRKGIYNWYASESGDVVIGMGWRKKEAIMLARTSTTAEWRELQDNKLFAEGRFLPAYIEADNKNLIVQSSQESGRMALYRFDIEKGALAGKIFGHGDYDVGNVLFDQQRRALAAVSYIGDRVEYQFINPEYKKVMAGIDKKFPNRENIILNVSNDEQYFLIYSSSDVYPGAYYRYSRATRELMFFGEDNSEINPALMSRMRPYSYFSKDGLEIPAYLTLPKDVEAKGLPLVIYPHGDIDDRNKIGYDYVVQFLASRGIAVLQPNYRGSSGYGYSYGVLSEGEWGGTIQDDIEQGVQSLIRDGTVDPDRVCIMGERFAGYTALMASIQAPDTYNCVITLAAYVNLEKYLKRLKKAKRKDFIRQIKGDRKSKEMKQVSPMRGVRNIKADVLLFHGEDDNVVPMGQVEDFIKASKKAGGSIRLVELKDTGRYLTKPRIRLIFLREVEKFLIKQLGIGLPEKDEAGEEDKKEATEAGEGGK